MMRITREEFIEQAITISTILVDLSLSPRDISTHRCKSDKRGESPEENMPLLHDWKISSSSSFSNDKYLIHPPILQKYTASINNRECRKGNISEVLPVEDFTYDDLIENDEEIDESYHDEMAQIPLESDDHTMNRGKIENDPPIVMEWFFSVAYHDTWGVPVLYFRVLHMTGEQCSRMDVLNALSCSDDDDETYYENGWDFISQEEHPITGEPSYFLHPCQTSARLGFLFSLPTLSKNNIDDDFSESNARNSSGINHVIEGDNNILSNDVDDRKHNNNKSLLLSWIKMILPAVKCDFDIHLFHALQKEICNKSKN